MTYVSQAVEAFAGLGLFLFGMLYLESQIKASAGRSFRRWVRARTDGTLRSLLTGVFATAFFQSSSVVSLMALSLIGAQMISLASAVAIIFGANLGTTVTAWIVGLVGFKMDIRLLSYVLIGLGGLGGVVASEEGWWKARFGVMVGFGLLFLGLEGMKESFSVFADTFDPSQLHLDSVYWYVLIGFAVTAVIQSSSASIAIIQSALFTHFVTFDMAAAFVVGANVGTTVTVILGAIGGSPDKKRTALAHFLFNVSTGAVALALFSPLSHLTLRLFPGSDAVLQIALFHTIFNLLGVALWAPFVRPLARWLQRRFRKEPIRVTEYIHNVSVEVPELAVDALEKEVERLGRKVEEFALLAVNIPPPKVLEEHAGAEKLLDEYDENLDLSYRKLYGGIRRLEGEIYRYISTLRRQTLESGYESELRRLAQRTAYFATAAKSVKDMLHDLDRLYDAETPEEKAFLRNLRYQILRSVQAYDAALSNETDGMERMEKVYRRIADSYANSLELVHEIAANRAVPAEVTTIAVNDLHLVKSFTKSLRNALRLRRKGSEAERQEAVGQN